jgi:hypothetical protein
MQKKDKNFLKNFFRRHKLYLSVWGVGATKFEWEFYSCTQSPTLQKCSIVGRTEFRAAVNAKRHCVCAITTQT